jgi:hypothetical protein
MIAFAENLIGENLREVHAGPAFIERSYAFEHGPPPIGFDEFGSTGRKWWAQQGLNL